MKVSRDGLLGTRGLVPMQFEAIFRSTPPLGAKRSKSSVTTKNVQVSPPPENRTTTPMYIHRTTKGLHRSPPPVENFGAKTANQPLRWATNEIQIFLRQKHNLESKQKAWNWKVTRFAPIVNVPNEQPHIQKWDTQFKLAQIPQSYTNSGVVMWMLISKLVSTCLFNSLKLIEFSSIEPSLMANWRYLCFHGNEINFKESSQISDLNKNVICNGFGALILDMLFDVSVTDIFKLQAQASIISTLNRFSTRFACGS